MASTISHAPPPISTTASIYSKRLYALHAAVEKKRPSGLRPSQGLSRMC
jgi:hypothetical protein